MMYYGSGYGMMGWFGGIGMLLFWGALIWFIVWLVQRSRGYDRYTERQLDNRQEPEMVLKTRYAKGELTKKEYQDMLSEIRR